MPFSIITSAILLINDELVNRREVNVLAGEVMVVFHVLANEVNNSNNITISTFLHSLHLTCTR